MRNPFIAGNWKMFKTVHEAVVLRQRAARAGQGRHRRRDRRRAAVHRACTPWPKRRATRNIGVAAQNLLLGARGRVHRRGQRGDDARGRRRVRRSSATPSGGTLFGETDEIVNRKTRAALARRPRCRSSASARRSSSASATRRWPCSIGRSRTASTASPASRSPALVVAYEPVWAIGTGRNATPRSRREAHAHIRTRLRAVVRRRRGRARAACSTAAASSRTTSRELIAEPDVDGALVGGASLDAASFAEIVKRTQRR